MITFSMVVLGFLFAALCAFLILLVLIQPGKSSGGMGGLGGGAASAIGETLGASQGEKTLSKWTSIGMAAFFCLCLLLTVLGNLQHSSQLDLESGTPAAEQAPVSGAAPAGDAAPAPSE